MKIHSAEFEVSAPDLKSCPGGAEPEFAFIGRSNVGKSSLINLLTERRELAKVSDLPGKTRLINFFRINETWRLVDLPGYGYAKVGMKRRLDFNAAVADFLSGRRNLRTIFVLIDSRLPPQAIDLEFLRWLESIAATYALVFTKTDKQSAREGQANIAVFLQAVAGWRSSPPPVLTSSSQTRAGRRELLAHIQTVLDAPLSA
jgi:GTP-binding protein